MSNKTRPVFDFPHGFVMSESALYAFTCQDVYPDILSFASAIPDHLKPLFLIPIQMQFASSHNELVSKVIARSANTADADLFGTQTFVTDDNQSTVPSSEPGSIFDVDDADDMTHHQEYDYDQNIQVPTETSYMDDIDLTESGLGYPYRTDETVRKSSDDSLPRVLIIKLRTAVHPSDLEKHAPPKIRDNAGSCTVSLISYDKNSKIFTFSADCGNGAKQVQAKMSDIDQVSMSCNCPFWRWNGPEFHAQENSFMLGSPFGTADTPNVRDPDRKYWLCKHAYAVLRRLDNFIEEVVDENWDKDEDELLDVVDDEWDRLEGAAKVPLAEAEEDDIELDVDWDGDEPGDSTEEQSAEQFSSEDESVDVDLSQLDSEVGQDEISEDREPDQQEHNESDIDYQSPDEIDTSHDNQETGQESADEVDYEVPEKEEPEEE